MGIEDLHIHNIQLTVADSNYVGNPIKKKKQIIVMFSLEIFATLYSFGVVSFIIIIEILGG